MLRLKLWLVLAAMLALVAVGLTGGTVSASVADEQSEEAQVIALINAERAVYGLQPVTLDETLGAAAKGYAEYMAGANFFAHKGLDGSTLVTRAEAAGYKNWSFLAENLAAGQPTAARVVSAWMKSPSHRANVLSAEAAQVGIGRATNPDSKYRVYWAMEMGTPMQTGIPSGAGW
jgi:uncharacterized protein YkwD